MHAKMDGKMGGNIDMHGKKNGRMIGNTNRNLDLKIWMERFIHGKMDVKMVGGRIG